ncbi:MAG TPA: hypothetical protein VGI12_04470 [Vicinamibacterales bacterium]|jgi:hypothetical protein
MFGVRWLALCLLMQALPAGPIETARGTVTIAGEVTATVGSPDHEAYFNYTDYEHNALRMFRLALSGMWRPSSRFAFLTEIRSEDLDYLAAYAMYARVRPWLNHPLDIQAGRIPPVFGTFGRRAYGSDDALIGVPLAYQYLTSVRSDAVPASADDLLLMRARGWRASYPVGDQTPAPGVPIVSTYRWDTGIEANYAGGRVEAAVAVTAGTLSNPRVRDDNHGRQWSGRAAWKPVVGLVLGASGSRGAFLDQAIVDAYEPALGPHDYTQEALGVDGEYSRGYWIVRGEAIHSRWSLPQINKPFIDAPLGATAAYLEMRYRVGPRVFLGARGDRLTFSRITGERLFGGQPTPWDAPVTRVEAGGGVNLQRNLTLRAIVQRNWRDGGRVQERTYVSGQLAYWF